MRSPHKLILAAALLALPLGLAPHAHAKSLTNKLNLSLSYVGASTDGGTNFKYTGNATYGGSLIVECFACCGSVTTTTPCDVKFTCGDQIQVVSGVLLTANQCLTVKAPAFTVTQAVGTTLSISAEINPCNPTGYAVTESDHSDNKRTISLRVVQ